jgi:FkbM family methyltransferase
MNCCVYTALLGRYENLNEQPVASQSHLPFICLTDDASLQSASWNCRLIKPLFLEDPVRSQRDLKIRPHLYMGDYDYSIYIDNSVILKQPPERLLEMFDPKNGFLIPHHSFRESVLDEFLEVAKLGLDDSVRVFEQLNHYTFSFPDVLAERPWWSAILVRDHRSARVRSMAEIWASHVMRYSRRDQLSVNVAFTAANLSPTVLAIDNHDSDLHTWPVTNGRDRQQGTRNPNISFMPSVARVRHLEQQQENLKAELAKAEAKAEARKLKNRLRRLGQKILRLPTRAYRSLQSFYPTPPIERVRAPSGSWIYIDPSDGRGRSLVAAGGNLNPHTMAAWRWLLSEQAWTHIIDVGANYGEMLVHGDLPAGARLVAVEPNPAIRAYLKRTLDEAGLTVEIVDVALSDTNGEAALFIDTDWSGTSRLTRSGDKGTLSVRTTTLDAILRDIGAAPSSMRIALKVDVEGHEASVLRGLMSLLPVFEDFAALVEIMHIPDADLAWIADNFRLALLEVRPNGGLVNVPAGELKKMLASGLYYTQDAVLRRQR